MIFSEAEASDSGLSPIRMVKLLTLLVSVKIRQTCDSNIVQKLDKSLRCCCLIFDFLVRLYKVRNKKFDIWNFVTFGHTVFFFFLRSSGLLCDKMNVEKINCTGSSVGKLY